MAAKSIKPLQLLAFDADDLQVLSAHMQDALIRSGDMAFQPQARRFALVGSRFNWLAGDGRRHERRLTGMHFDHVVRVQRQGFDPAQNDLMLNLLGIQFDPSETPEQAPAGSLVLTFSGGASVRLEVECLEASMLDMNPRWPTRRKPGHALPKDALPKDALAKSAPADTAEDE